MAEPERYVITVGGKPLRPSGGRPYLFDTRDEAERVAAICYPGLYEQRAGVDVVSAPKDMSDG